MVYVVDGRRKAGIRGSGCIVDRRRYRRCGDVIDGVLIIVYNCDGRSS
jgi:hypothetical protein